MLCHYLLFDGRQMVLSMCPVFVRGHCTDLRVLSFHVTREAQPWTKQSLLVRSGGSLELHVVLEAAELEKQPG